MKKLLTVCLIAAMSFTLTNIHAAQKSKKSEKITTTACFLTDIDCESCAKKIMSSIPYQRGVKDVEVDVTKKEVVVTYDPKKSSNDALIKSFDRLKIKAKVIE